MSTQIVRTEYRCLNDCRQIGCPGHYMELHFHGSSDTTMILIDGEKRDIYDDNCLDALVKAYITAGEGVNLLRVARLIGKDNTSAMLNKGRKVRYRR